MPRNDKDLFELFYKLRVELDKANRNIYSEHDIALQAFEDYQYSDDAALTIVLFQAYRLYLDLENDYISDLIDNIKAVSNNYARLWILSEKANFIDNELKRLIKSMDENISEVFYVYKGDEYVCIIYKNNYKKHINITADSKKAIVTDVIRELH